LGRAGLTLYDLNYNHYNGLSGSAVFIPTWSIFYNAFNNPAIEDMLDIEGIDPMTSQRIQMAEITIQQKSFLDRKRLYDADLKKKAS